MKRVICIKSSSDQTYIGARDIPDIIKDEVYHVVQDTYIFFMGARWPSYILAETGDAAYDIRFFADAPVSVEEMIEEALSRPEKILQPCELSV